MLTEKSKQMMTRSFEKARYRFETIPQRAFGSAFGIYVHVPFCKTMCAFCPFYKELYSEERKGRYLDAIEKEIRLTEMNGSASWLYIGGGTPNVLSLDELRRLLGAIRAKSSPPSVGIELHPSLLDTGYLEGLAEIGFTKVSMGIESLQDSVLTGNGRRPAAPGHIDSLLRTCRSRGLWSNVDMMVGLAKQRRESFLADIEALAAMSPSQVTIYPYMIIRNTSGTPSMSNAEQFRLIEEAGEILLRDGYSRKGVWVFGKGDDIYDSSRDELVTDYAGFGPCAFSTYGAWKVVNPELAVYLDSWLNDSPSPVGFVSPKTQATDDWRKFARMLYDLHCRTISGVPVYINAFIALLRLSGYSRKGSLSPKGVFFAHEITKTVVESLPFPVQNPRVVDNYAEYLAHKSRVRAEVPQPVP